MKCVRALTVKGFFPGTSSLSSTRASCDSEPKNDLELAREAANSGRTNVVTFIMLSCMLEKMTVSLLYAGRHYMCGGLCKGASFQAGDLVDVQMTTPGCTVAAEPAPKLLITWRENCGADLRRDSNAHASRGILGGPPASRNRKDSGF